MRLRSIARAVDWIGLRLAIVVALGLTAFVVLQPLVWTEVLHKDPPAGVSDLASLTAIVVTIMSLGLAAFGVVSFQLIEKRVERDLQERARVLREDLEMQAAKASARLFLNICFQAFLSYDDRWSAATRPYSWEAAEDPDFREILDSALDNAEQALSALEKLPSHQREIPDTKKGIDRCKANVAYFLATRRNPDDKTRALAYVRDIESPDMTWEDQETVAWVRLCYATPGHEQWLKGIDALRGFIAREDAPDDIKKKARKKYATLFESSEGIQEALEGRAPGQEDRE